MKEVKYTISHQYQPTATSCSPTAFSTMLGHYNHSVSPLDLANDVPQVRDEKGEVVGSINQQFATWFLVQGYSTKIISSDVQLLDQSWSTMSREDQITRLEKRKSGWEVPSMGALFTEAYAQSYIDFLRAGGELQIVPYISSNILYKLLESGPVVPAVCFATLHGSGRSKMIDGEFKKDDIGGRAPTHSIVIYGHDEDGNFYISDPDRKPGLHSIEPERMVAAIATAQIECDNLIVQIEKSNV